MATCINPGCGKELTGRQKYFCSHHCANLTWSLRNAKGPRPDGRISAREQARLERYARIKAQYGAPGMGIAPIGKVRTLRAVKF